MTGRRASRCSRKCASLRRATRRCRWLAGAFYYTNEFKRGDAQRSRYVPRRYVQQSSGRQRRQSGSCSATPFPLPVAAPGQLGFLASNLDTEYLGVYGQSTWNLSDQFLITGGVRWQEESKEANIRQWVNNPAPSIISLLLVAGGGQRERPRARYQRSDLVGDAAVARHGQRDAVRDRRARLQVGRIQYRLRTPADRAARVRRRGHHALRGGRQVRAARRPHAARGERVQHRLRRTTRTPLSSARSSRSATPSEAKLEGAELEGELLLGERLTADFAVSYADLVYDKNTHGQCYPGRAPNSTTTPGACDLSGEHPVNAPEWKTHLGLQYEQPVSWGDLFARADWSWTSEYNTSFSADPRLKQDAYSWVNLRAGTRWSNYEVALWADNVTDETVVNLDAVVTLYAARRRQLPESAAGPRSYGVTFRVNY